MRTALILAFASIFAATSVVACAVEPVGSSSLSKRPKSTHDDGDDDDDDSDPTVEPPSVGENDVDPGNPNANTTAPPPTGTATAAQGFAIDVDNNTPTIDLAAESTINVTVTPKNGFTGTVTITVDGLPTGVTAAPASGTSTIALKLTSSATTPVTPKDGAVPLTIKGTSGDQTATAPANFKVLPKIVMTVPTNSDALIKAGGQGFTAGWGGDAFANGTPLLTQADNPIVVTVRNDDSTPRTVHGPGGTNGFAHGAGPIDPGAFELQNGQPRQRSFKPGAKTSGYLHGLPNNAGTAVGFKLNVSATQ
jgi:hypothetical protein